MGQEFAEIARFLGSAAPFNLLGEDVLARISRQVTITYFPAGETVLSAGEINNRLMIVRSGAVELRLAGEELTARLEPGSAFAYPSILRGGEVRNTAIAMEDTLLYQLPGALFLKLREDHKRFREYFVEDEADRIRHALRRRESGAQGMFDTTQVDSLLRRSGPVVCSPQQTIREAAQIMRERDVSTLAVCDDTGLVGIFSDKDLRNRVVAAGVSGDHAVREVMTPRPKTLPTDASVAEAMALMAAGGFRHVPLIAADGALAGVISSSDILAFLGSNAIDAGLAIARADSPAALVAAAARIPESFVRMEHQGLGPAHIMRFVSALGEAAHRRAAQLAEAELGKPPVPYALVVFGSLAREEQLVGSDQDNGLVIDDAMAEGDAAYFAQLGGRISDLLNDCGFVYCNGGIMAKEAAQRLTAGEWQRRYTDWIERPDEDKILRATIFFDMRCVHGEAALVDSLRENVLQRAAASSIFASYLARDAQRSKVPLGFFRNLVLESTADGEKVFDVKAQAVMPVIDIARTTALAHGISAVGTADRLDAIVRAGKMASGDAQSLKDAMVLVNDLRIRHQAQLLAAGKAPENAIAPATLSPLERDHLKDAFAVIRGALDSLRRNLAGGIA